MKTIEDLFIDKFLDLDEKKQNAMMSNMYYSIFNVMRPDTIYYPILNIDVNLSNPEQTRLEYERFYKNRLFFPSDEKSYQKIKECFDNQFNYQKNGIYHSKNNLIHLVSKRERGIIVYFPMINYENKVKLIIEYKVRVSAMRYAPFGCMYKNGVEYNDFLKDLCFDLNYDRHILKNYFLVYKVLKDGSNMSMNVTVPYLSYFHTGNPIFTISDNFCKPPSNKAKILLNKSNSSLFYTINGIEEFHPPKDFLQFHVFNDTTESFLPLFDQQFSFKNVGYSLAGNATCYSPYNGVCPNLKFVGKNKFKCKRFNEKSISAFTKCSNSGIRGDIYSCWQENEFLCRIKEIKLMANSVPVDHKEDLYDIEGE